MTTPSAASTRRISLPKRWRFIESDEAAAIALAGELDIPDAVARILCARGYANSGRARAFLFPSLDHLHDPLLLLGMRDATARVHRAIAAGERIEIHGDYDVDGVTSIVLLKSALEMAGARVSYWAPHRVYDGYGLHVHAVERAAAEGVKLIISVDTGIRAVDTVERARELGVDMIVTDHHLPDARIPNALAVLNPNRPGCGYPDKNLCGAGVAFKLAQAVLRELPWPEDRLRKVLLSFLKLVAIATVSDVAALTGENRVIVAHGLRGLADPRNPGLRALLSAAGIATGRAPKPHQVGFRIGPRLNAAGRMASAMQAIELFLCGEERAREIAGQLSELNRDRQDTEAAIVDEIVALCESEAQSTMPAALVFAGDGWHRGVLGIVASRLVERFCRPVFVLGVENGTASGSGRSIERFHLLNALESMRDLFEKFGGHEQAAGLTIPTARLPQFRETLARFAAAVLREEDYVPLMRVDAVTTLKEMDTAWHSLRMLEPCGMGNPAPVLAVRDVEIASDPAPFGEDHLRVRAAQDGRVVMFKAFSFASRISELARGARVDIAFKMEDDEWTGAWAARVCDVRPAV